MTKHNIWSISIIITLFVLLFSPLVVASSLYFPYVTGKLFLFRALISLATIAYLILVLQNPNYLPKKSSILIISGVFVAWLAISNFFGVDPYNSYLGNYERMEGWFTHLYLFIFLIVLSSVMQKEKLWNWFFAVSVIVANILSLYGAFDAVERTNVFLGNSTYVAIYVFFNMCFAILLAYRLFKKNVKEQLHKVAGMIYYISSILLFIYIIFRTQTRGTVLSLVAFATIFAALFAFYTRKNKKVRFVIGGIMLLGIIALGTFYVNRDSSFVQNNPMLSRVASISATEGTGRARIVNWSIALNGIAERPIVGWGQENYAYVFQKYYDPEMYNQEPWFDRTHNTFIDWAVQGGLVALVLYLLLVLSALYAIQKSTSLDRIEKSILIATIGGYMVHNLFVFDNYASYLMFFGLLGFVVHHSQKELFAWNVSQKAKEVSVIILIAVICISGYFVILKPYGVARNLIRSLTTSDANQALILAQKTLESNTFGTNEAVIRLLQDTAKFTEVKDPQFIQTYLETAQSAGERMITRFPDNVRLKEAYAIFLMRLGQNEKAVEILEHARTLAPNRHANLYLLTSAYLQTNQFEKAKEVMEHLYTIKSDVEQVQTYYGATLLLTGDENGKKLLGNYDYKNPFYLDVFNKTKQYDQVVSIYERRVQDTPDDYQLQVHLAISYVYNKQPLKAIETLQNVVKNVPEFTGQGNFLIKEIRAGRNPALTKKTS